MGPHEGPSGRIPSNTFCERSYRHVSLRPHLRRNLFQHMFPEAFPPTHLANGLTDTFRRGDAVVLLTRFTEGGYASGGTPSNTFYGRSKSMGAIPPEALPLIHSRAWPSFRGDTPSYTQALPAYDLEDGRFTCFRSSGHVSRRLRLWRHSLEHFLCRTVLRTRFAEATPPEEFLRTHLADGPADTFRGGEASGGMPFKTLCERSCEHVSRRRRLRRHPFQNIFADGPRGIPSNTFFRTVLRTRFADATPPEACPPTFPPTHYAEGLTDMFRGGQLHSRRHKSERQVIRASGHGFGPSRVIS